MSYAVIKNLLVGGEKADVKLYGFSEIGDVDLHEEMTGKTSVLVDAALKHVDSTALYGVHFLLDDMERFAVVSFHNGILVDVSDCMLHMGMEENMLPELKVYTVDGVSLGIVVDDDIDSDTVWKHLEHKADAVVCITRNFDEERKKRIDALQKKHGLPAVVCKEGELYVFGLTLIDDVVGD